MCSERFNIRVRRSIELAFEQLPVLLCNLECTSTIAGSGECLHERGDDLGIEWRVAKPTTPQLDRGRLIAGMFGGFSQSFDCQMKHPLKPFAFEFLPLFERGCAGKAEPVQKRATVKLQAHAEILAIDSGDELEDVDANITRLQAHRLPLAA